jgi:hypothetical protein
VRVLPEFLVLALAVRVPPNCWPCYKVSGGAVDEQVFLARMSESAPQLR